MDSLVPLMHHDQRDVGLICLLKKCKIRFSDSFRFKNPIIDFLKETYPKSLKVTQMDTNFLLW